MTKYTHSRQREYQRRVIKQGGLDPLPYESMAPTWWRNPTNVQSLRLTQYGFKFFTTQLNLPYHEIKLSEPLKSKNLLQLERLFSEPYFVRTESIIVMSEEDAIMLQLHAGNLGQYLDNLETAKH